MIKSAIEKICELAKPQVIEKNGTIYTNASFFEIEKPKQTLPSTLTVHSLDALMSMIRNEGLNISEKLFVSVQSFGEVHCFLEQKECERFERVVLYYASMTDVPRFMDRWMDYDTSIIKLRSLFQPNEGTQYILDLLSRITIQDNEEQQDNGVTQTVTVRKGVALAGAERVKPIVKLKPYRTFQEIDQPESDFLLRVRDGNEIGLFEADGGMWKLEARNRIKAYLAEQMADLIEQGRVILML